MSGRVYSLRISVREGAEMALRPNKFLRNFGVYKLFDEKLILLKRTEELSFLFNEKSWNLRGPVDYRVSHGDIYRRGELTGWTDDDLLDTGMTANPPNELYLKNWIMRPRRIRASQ